MKKLMVVALAGVAGVAMAAEKLADGVYSITVTDKGLVKSEVVKTVKGQPVTNEVSKVVTTTLNGYYFVGGDLDGQAVAWDAKDTASFTNTFAKADTTKAFSLSGKKLPEDPAAFIKDLEARVGTVVDAVVAGSIAVTTDKKTEAVTKIAWKEITKKNAVKLAQGEKADISLGNVDIAADGKSQAVIAWNNLAGAGTGTATKDKETKAYTTVNSVSGNVVDTTEATYGTWKMQPDAAATKLYNNGASVEEILAKKKVELVK